MCINTNHDPAESSGMFNSSPKERQLFSSAAAVLQMSSEGLHHLAISQLRVGTTAG